MTGPCWNAFCVDGNCDGVTHVDVRGCTWVARAPTHRVLVNGVEEVRGTAEDCDSFVNHWRAKLVGRTWALEHRADDGQWTPVPEQPEWSTVPGTE